MHGWDSWWGGNGMAFGPAWMVIWLVLLVAAIIAIFRWLGDNNSARGEGRTVLAKFSMSATHAARSIATNI